VNVSYNPTTLKPDGYVHQIIAASSTADTGTYRVKVTGTAVSGKTYERYYSLHVQPVPNSKPRIIFTGGASIIHTLNTIFTEPGYQATDLEDGNLTAQVQTSGTVNYDSVGIYKLTYKVTDSGGNSDSLTRTVTVKNSLDYLNGQFTCTTTNLGNGAVHNWITSLSTSIYVNNQFTIFKISDCYQADPITYYMPSKDSIFVDPQTFTCITPTDTLSHTFTGKGKVVNSGGVVNVTLYYTDNYFDSGAGSNVTVSKRDVYVK
jgi:hypothetical protein